MSLLFGHAPDLELVEEDVDMDGNRTVDLPEPTTDSEPVSKGYADKHYLGRGAQGSKGDKGDKDDRGLLGPQGYRGQRGI